MHLYLECFELQETMALQPKPSHSENVKVTVIGIHNAKVISNVTNERARMLFQAAWVVVTGTRTTVPSV